MQSALEEPHQGEPPVAAPAEAVQVPVPPVVNRIIAPPDPPPKAQDGRSPTTCPVDVTMPPSRTWHRAIAGTKVAAYQPIEPKSWTHIAHDPDMPGIEALLFNTRLGEKIRHGVTSSVEIESLVKDCTNSSLASSNVFYQRDDPDHRKADKKAFDKIPILLGGYETATAVRCSGVR